MSIGLEMPCNHLILCHALLLLPSVFPSIRVFSNELAVCIRWPECWSFGFSINPSREHSRLISFRIDWLMKVKEESIKAGLRVSIQETDIMASGPITSWQIDGETMETVTDFFFFFFRGSEITAHGNCSHEIKRHFLLGRKAITNLESILKSRDITLPTKFCLVKVMVFPVLMYGC